VVWGSLAKAAAVLREGTMTNEEKKAILKQYIGLEKRIARLLDEKKKWKEKAEAISPVYSDMPKAGGCDKIQNAVCQIVDLEQDINREIDAQIDLCRRIEAAVKQMDDEKLRDVMMYRYIDGLKLEEIAIEMSYSYMQIYRLHKKAISEIML
jgi:DNA-directed RNA polymerase specialized sigma subunit